MTMKKVSCHLAVRATHSHRLCHCSRPRNSAYLALSQPENSMLTSHSSSPWQSAGDVSTCTKCGRRCASRVKNLCLLVVTKSPFTAACQLWRLLTIFCHVSGLYCRARNQARRRRSRMHWFSYRYQWRYLSAFFALILKLRPMRQRQILWYTEVPKRNSLPCWYVMLCIKEINNTMTIINTMEWLTLNP